MKIRKILYILFGIFFTVKVIAQPKPCGAVPAMTSTCIEACIICDIDGFTGINNSNIQGQAPPGFCTSVVHHMQWIAFIAGTENLSIELTVIKCNSGTGLEVGIYESFDCDKFKLVTDCDTDMPQGTKRVFKNLAPLTVGQYYYWVMDGGNNDVCTYSIKVLEGSTKVSPLEKAAEIIVPPVLCEDKEISFKTNGIPGATIYDWSIDGKLIFTGTEMKQTFEKSGTYTVCLDARNVCDKAPQNCLKINVLPTPTSEFHQEICFGECYTFHGKQYCKTDKYPIVLTAVNGCDSIVTLDLKVEDEIVTSQAFKICEGDTLKLGDGSFVSNGQHVAHIIDADGCRIKVNIDLSLIKCNIKSTSDIGDVKCNNDKNGTIKYKITNGTGPFTYTWTKIENNSINGKGTIANEGDVLLMDSLDEGNYKIEVQDTFGNLAVHYAHVKQPSDIKNEVSSKEYNGFSVPCFGQAEGDISLSTSGGNGTYNYMWSNNATTASIANLTAGVYTCTISDKNNCKDVVTKNISSPEKLNLVTTKHNPDCSGEETGYIDATATTGGVQPYEFQFNQSPFSANPILNNLGSSLIKITVKDKNGCEDSKTDTLNAAEIPNLTYDSIVKVDLGDSVFIKIISSLTSQTVQWENIDGVKCTTCLETSLEPLNTSTYIISVTSKDGCLRKATINVVVVKNYSFETSNIITANGDGINDNIRYNTKKDAASVLKYDVYDRWGSKVFASNNRSTGLVQTEWDGTFNGKKLEQGAYAWIASVLYKDGVVINYKGTVTITR